MIERVIFPDAAKAVTTFLGSELASLSDVAQVSDSVPDPRPARFVLVRRNDRSERNDVEDREGRRGVHLALDRPRLTMECSDDSGDAAGLAELVGAIVRAAAPGYIDTVWCDYIEDAGSAFTEDPVSGQPTCLITVDLIVRGKILD